MVVWFEKRGNKPATQWRAMTLLELIVVVMILGILAAIAAFAYRTVVISATDAHAKQMLASSARGGWASQLLNEDPQWTTKAFLTSLNNISPGNTSNAAQEHLQIYSEDYPLSEGGLSVQGTTMTDVLQMHVAINPAEDGHAGLATVSSSGRCWLAFTNRSAVIGFVRYPEGDAKIGGVYPNCKVDYNTMTEPPPDGGNNGGGGSTDTIVAVATSNHDRAIPVEWEKINSGSIVGYTVTCTASGHPTGTSTLMDNSTQNLSTVVEELDNGVEYNCTVESIPTNAANPGSDTATPSALCLPTGIVGAGGRPECWQTGDPPPVCQGDECTQDPWLDTTTAWRTTILAANAGGASTQITDTAIDSERNRILAVTKRGRVLAINPETGAVTTIHDRLNGTNLCPGGGNTSCGGYTQISIIDDTAYLLFGSTTDGNCGLGTCPWYSDVVALNLNSPTDGALPLVCRGGNSNQGSAVANPPYTESGAWGIRYIAYGPETTSLTADDTSLYISYSGTSGPVIRKILPTIGGSSAPYAYGTNTIATIVERIDGAPSCETAGTQLGTLTGGRTVGLATNNNTLYALQQNGTLSSVPTTGGTPTTLTDLDISSQSGAYTQFIESSAVPVRGALYVTDNYIYYADGHSIWRVNKANFLDATMLAGSIDKNTEGIGVSAGMEKTPSITGAGETIFYADGTNIGYLSKTSPWTTNTQYANDGTAGPGASATSQGTIAIAGTIQQTIPDETGNYAYISVAGSGSGVYKLNLTNLNLTNTGCSFGSNNPGRLSWAGPEGLWISEYTTSATGNMPVYLCNVKTGVTSSGYSVNAGSWPTSTDNGQALVTSSTGTFNIGKWDSHLWIGSGSRINLGSWTPTTNPTACSSGSRVLKTSSGVLRYCSRGLPFTPMSEYGYVPYTSTAIDTYTSAQAANGSSNVVSIDTWAAAGQYIYTTNNATIYRSGHNNINQRVSIATLPRTISSVFVANGQLWATTSPLSGSTTIYKIN